MPNKNYRRGVAIERKAKAELELDGYTVVRTAGSHGPWDLVAVKEGSQEPVRCIQVKRTGSPLGAKRLKNKWIPYVAPTAYTCYKHELWIWVDRKGWELSS